MGGIRVSGRLVYVQVLGCGGMDIHPQLSYDAGGPGPFWGSRNAAVGWGIKSGHACKAGCGEGVGRR
jgi:hypothetical protein